jgi:hypothetical protein
VLVVKAAAWFALIDEKLTSDYESLHARDDGAKAAAWTPPRPATCELQKDIKISVQNNLGVNAYSAAPQEQPRKL